MRLFLLFQAFIFVIITSMGYQLRHYEMKRMANLITHSLERYFEIGDYREALLNLSRVAKTEFQKVEYQDLHNNQFYRQTYLANSDAGKELGWLTAKINKKIRLKTRNHEFIVGSLSYFYSWQKMFFICSAFWVFLFLLSLTYFFRLQQKYQRQYKKEMELKLNQMMVEMSLRLSHDIRSPIAVLNMIAKTEKGLSADNKEMFIGCVERIGSMVDDLLIKRKEFQKQKTELHASIDIALEIKKIVEEKQREFSTQKNVEIRFSFDHFPHPPMIAGDAILFKTALSNLINNAVEAKNPNQEKVIVEIKLEQIQYLFKNKIKIMIEDNGVGIEKKLLRIIGQRKLVNKNKGNGLGLYYAFRQIKKMKGKISIISKRNLGTTFSIVFVPIKAS